MGLGLIQHDFPAFQILHIYRIGNIVKDGAK